MYSRLSFYLFLFQSVLFSYFAYLQLNQSNAWSRSSRHDDRNLRSLSIFSRTPPMRMQLSDIYELNIPADRAVLTIEVTAEGTNQNRVSEDIKTTQNEIIDLLQPLTKISANFTITHGIPVTDTVSITVPSAIVHLGVNTFEANAPRKKQTFLGEKALYSASAKYSAEFADFDVLGRVIYKLTRLPRTRIASLTWKLSDEVREDAASESQRTAARLLMSKARNLAESMGRDNVRAMSIYERSHRVVNDVVLMSVEDGVGGMHDELDDGPVQEPAVQFEPKTIEFTVELDGEFEGY